MSYTALPTKNPGDLLTSALWNTYLKGNADSGFMRMIADTTLGASAATVDFTSIPATFAHLMLVGLARGDTAAVTTSILLRFNGDAGASYAVELLQGSGAAASAAAATGGTSMQLGSIAAATAADTVFTPVWCLIPNYLNTVAGKDALSLCYSAGGTQLVQLAGGHWPNLTAVNRITLLLAAGNFLTGTRFTLYGVPQ